MNTLKSEHRRTSLRERLASENFCIQRQDGTQCVVANSNWVLVQKSQMRPARITEEDSSPYELGTPLDMPYADRKIAAPKEGIVMEPITVRTEHLDSNHHVNNTQYVLMASRYLPSDFSLHQVRAEYRYQALLGDYDDSCCHERRRWTDYCPVKKG